MGVMRLPPGIQAVALRRISTAANTDRFFMLGLRVPATKVRGQSVLAPAGLFSEHRNLFMETGRMLHTIRTGRRVESSACYDWLEHEDLNF